MSAESDYFENPIQVDKGRLGKSEQGPIDIATPWRRPWMWMGRINLGKKGQDYVWLDRVRIMLSCIRPLIKSFSQQVALPFRSARSARMDRTQRLVIKNWIKLCRGVHSL